MGTQYKSLREFAKMAQVAPQRVRELINEGKITSVEGRIPITQLSYFMKEDLLRYASRNGGVLYIAINTPDDEVNKLSAELESQGVTIISSIDDFINNLGTESMDKLHDLTSEHYLHNRYKKLILKEFVKRLKLASQRNLMKYCEDEKISVIALGCLYELMLHNNIYSCDEDELKYAKTVCKNPLADMERSFGSIIYNLNLYDSATGEPLLSRDDITPDFVEAVEELKDDVSSVTEGVLSDIFAKSFCWGSEDNGKGEDAQKVVEYIANNLHKLAKSQMISNITSKGFCSILNLQENITDTEIYKVSADLAGGFYSEVKFLCSKEEAQSNLSDAMALMFNSLAVAHKFRISYSE